MFSSRDMTDFSSLQKLYLVLMPQNRHQRVTSTVTRLLVRQVWHLAIPTTANQAAQTELASLVPRLITSPGTRLAWVMHGRHVRFCGWCMLVLCRLYTALVRVHRCNHRRCSTIFGAIMGEVCTSVLFQLCHWSNT